MNKEILAVVEAVSNENPFRARRFSKRWKLH